MSVFCCKTLLQIIEKNVKFYVHHALRIPFHPKSFSQISKSTKSPAIVVDYLVNSSGLSHEKAVSEAKRIPVEFTTTKKPDSVLRFFECNGFSKTLIAKTIASNPRLLRANVDHLKPKMMQLRDLGLSDLNIADVIASNSNILKHSLDHHLVPTIKFLKSFLGTDENVVKAIKRTSWLLSVNLKWRIQPNISLLQNYQVPNSRIAFLMMNRPRSLLVKTESLKDHVEYVKALGFKSETGAFTNAIYTFFSMNKSTWDARVKLLMDLGWSEEQFFSAFRRMPVFILASEKKIKEMMDFFANKLNWNASVTRFRCCF